MNSDAISMATQSAMDRTAPQAARGWLWDVVTLASLNLGSPVSCITGKIETNGLCD